MTAAYDTIVVGAGSAGSVLAARLTEDPSRRVLLVDAGPDHTAATLPPELTTLSRPIAWPHDWGDEVVTVGGRRLHYGRGRVVGGSSLTNGGVALRAEPDDLDTMPDGWRFDDLLPAFRRSETDLDFGDRPHHGDRGPIPIVRWPRDGWTPLQTAFHTAATALGAPDCEDHNEPGTTGVGPIPMNRRGRTRMSNLLTYLEPARPRPNLEIRGDTHVRRIRFSGTRVTGIELADGALLAAGEVVVCAGVVQGPLLLARSGIGPARRIHELGGRCLVDNAHVGAHLTDHYVITYATRIDARLVGHDDPSLQVILRATAPGSHRTHDLQLPDGEGTVHTDSLEPDARPLISWPFAGVATNADRLRAGWRLAADIARASELALDPDAIRRDLDLDDATVDAHVLDEHTAFYHGVGTCRMSTDPDDGVVDPACRVHGTTGLRIVDASILPTVPRSNTHLVVVALAEHAAAALDW